MENFQGILPPLTTQKLRSFLFFPINENTNNLEVHQNNRSVCPFCLSQFWYDMKTRKDMATRTWMIHQHHLNAFIAKKHCQIMKNKTPD